MSGAFPHGKYNLPVPAVKAVFKRMSEKSLLLENTLDGKHAFIFKFCKNFDRKAVILI